MNLAISFLLVGGVVVLMLYLMRRQNNGRRSEYGPSGISEFRTDLPLDECMDRLAAPDASDIFAYTCRREADGGYRLHFTMHRPTQQPLDTVYTLRLDPGRQTVVTLIFFREAFGYREPVFPSEMLDAFMAEKLAAHRVH
jgi:hypothetical protein